MARTKQTNRSATRAEKLAVLPVAALRTRCAEAAARVSLRGFEATRQRYLLDFHRRWLDKAEALIAAVLPTCPHPPTPNGYNFISDAQLLTNSLREMIDDVTARRDELAARLHVARREQQPLLVALRQRTAGQPTSPPDVDAQDVLVDATADDPDL